MTDIFNKNSALFKRGTLNLISSRPVVGKSGLALSIADSSKTSVLYISLVDEVVKIQQRIDNFHNPFSVKNENLTIESFKFIEVNQLINYIISKKNEYDTFIVDDIDILRKKNTRFFSKKDLKNNSLLIRLKQLALASEKSIILCGTLARKFDRVHFNSYPVFCRRQNIFDSIIIPYRWEYYNSENIEQLKENETIISVVNNIDSKQFIIRLSAFINTNCGLFQNIR